MVWADEFEGDIHGMDQYTSARLNIANKQSWKYGKIGNEVQAQRNVCEAIEKNERSCLQLNIFNTPGVV